MGWRKNTWETGGVSKYKAWFEYYHQSYAFILRVEVRHADTYVVLHGQKRQWFRYIQQG